MRRSLVLACSLALAAPSLGAQRQASDSIRDDRNFSFYAKGPYRTTVPRPDSLLGYHVGSWHTQYGQQERVLLAIAQAAPDRVRVEEIGVSNEKRTMRIYIVSTPENLARLGRGNLVMVANEPMFRGFRRALDRIVLNAIIAGSGR